MPVIWNAECSAGFTVFTQCFEVPQQEPFQILTTGFFSYPFQMDVADSLAYTSMLPWTNLGFPKMVAFNNNSLITEKVTYSKQVVISKIQLFLGRR